MFEKKNVANIYLPTNSFHQANNTCSLSAQLKIWMVFFLIKFTSCSVSRPSQNNRYINLWLVDRPDERLSWVDRDHERDHALAHELIVIMCIITPSLGTKKFKTFLRRLTTFFHEA